MSGEEEPKPVLKSTNVAALYDLKAEFLTRKSQLKASQSTTGLARNLSRPGVLFQTKKELEEKEMRKRKQTERINRCEAAVRKEEEERQRQKRVLEEKAKIYERLTSGEHLVGEDGKDVEFLVNFEMKKREMEQQEEEKRRDEDDRKRSRWERERPEPDYEDEEERPPSPAHEPLVTRYDPSEEPGRIFGPSHMALPKDEEERLKKIKEVQDQSKETEQTRQKRKKQLGEKKRAEREKLKRFRAKMNMSPLPSTSEEDEDEEDERRPGPSHVPGPNPASIPLPEPPKPRNQTAFGMREWDEGKRGYRVWKEREEEKRDNDFRPPSSYYH